MRPLLAAAAFAASLMSAGLAAAQPASVSVSIGRKLERLGEETYGRRDVAELAADLKRSVERELARTGALPGARVELVLVDARPNHPTFKQLGDRPGLAYQSVGLGGATIEGRIIAADGAETPVAYRWYETEIWQSAYGATWSDAEWTFDRFSRRLASERTIARR